VFPDIAYLSWIEGRPEAVAHDLASSDLRPATRADGPIPERLAGLEAGDRSLEAQLAEEYDVAVDEVLVTAGATNANALAFAVAADAPASTDGGPTDPDAGGTARSDESAGRVLVESPGYEPHVRTPRAFGAVVDRFRRPEGALDPARVADAVDPATTLAVVSDRHNPTGVRADRDAVRETAAAVGDAGARLLVDEVYAPFSATPTDGAFGGPTAAGVDGAVVTGSLTKFHGFGPLRVGWLVGDREFVAAAERVQRHVPSVAAPSTHLARRVLANHDALAGDRRDRVDRNHRLLAAFVADRDDLHGDVPDGSTYALLAHDALDGDALVDRALANDVLLVPGRFFDRPDAVRVSLGRPTEQVAAALDALGDALDDGGRVDHV